MNKLSKGLLLALLQVLLVCTLGAKLLYDRSHRPHIWIKVSTLDPDLPIRGRYLSLNLEVPAQGFSLRPMTSLYVKDKDGKPLVQEIPEPSRGNLVLQGEQLVEVGDRNGEYSAIIRRRDGGMFAIVNPDTTYFLPEHGLDPSRRQPGEELWIDATIPRKGPPRPIRLGIKKDGVLTPLPSE